MRRPAALVCFVVSTVAIGCSHTAPLLHPTPEEFLAPAPDSFRVDFQTTRGPFVVMAHRDWSPQGVDRLYFLVSNKYYDDTYFFRVVKGYVAQWGISGDPKVDSVWAHRTIGDDPVVHGNTRGTIAFARSGPHTRGVQLYVNYADNTKLDTLNGFGFPAIAQVVQGMGALDSVYSGYGDGPRKGRGPSQDSISHAGNAYLKRHFPLLDRVISARITQSWGDTLSASMMLRRSNPTMRGRGGRGSGGDGGGR